MLLPTSFQSLAQHDYSGEASRLPTKKGIPIFVTRLDKSPEVLGLEAHPVNERKTN